MKRKSPLVSIIIVNWNGGEVLRQCLESLSKIDYPNWELVLVDNGSTDDSHQFAKKFVSNSRQLRLIENQSNLGFAVANDQGYKLAKGEYILLLNNDTKVEPDFVSKLVQRLEKDPTIGVIYPKIFLMDKPGYLDNTGTFFTQTGFLEHWGFMQKDGPEFEKETEIFSAKGACMLIRRDVIERIGLFDNDFGSYFEDSDFCWRVWMVGFRVLFYPNARIYHKVGFSSKRQSQLFVNYHSNKNRICTLIKNLELFNLFLIGGTHLLINFGLTIYYLLKLEFGKSWMITKAILWNLFHLSRTLVKRKRVQKLRVYSDSWIFKKVAKDINLAQMFAHFGRVEANFRKLQ